MKRTRRTLCALALLAGCALPPTQAEQATFAAIAPEYREYVANDPKLDGFQKQRRIDLIETWRIRVGGAK